MTALLPKLVDLQSEQLQAIAAAARAELWRAGDLAYKLDTTQLDLYEDIKASPQKLWATEGARKLGKSYAHGVIALETAIANPGKQINWGAVTAKACRSILVPILEEISQDAPPECKGHYYAQDNQWRLPNGAFIQLFGAETKADCERARGPSSILSILDEAGFHPLLEYLVDSVLSPQMRRVRRLVGTFVGLTLLVSTTPYTPGHAFCQMADSASLRAAYRNFTIYDSGFESLEEIERYIASEAEKKGLAVEAYKQTSTFQREYLSRRVVDTEAVVFPEFHASREKVVRKWERPIGFERFIYRRVALDLGMVDKTGLLFGYIDFTNAKIVVEAERLLDKPNTSDIAAVIAEVEASLWPDANPSRVSRVIDDPQGRVVLDLWELHRLRTEKATKDNRLASIGLIRTYLSAGTLVIDPSCVHLQKQLLEAMNTPNGKDFQRTTDGHSDLAAALMYFVRGASLTLNPYPSDFDALSGRTLPDHHPLMARRETLRQPQHQRGLAGALLSGNKYVQGQLRRRRG